jgi:hypothetical protein
MLNKNTNYTDAIYTAAHLVLAFQRMVSDKLPATRVIFDDQLSYETGLEQLLNSNHFNQNLDQEKPDNLFIYNRSVMENSIDGAGSRLRQQRGVLNTPDGVLSYRPVMGEFDINFLFASHTVEDMYKFETFYGTNGGLGEKEVTLKLDVLGNFTYYLQYLGLTEVRAASGSPDTTYKMIGGTIRAKGIFFTFMGSQENVAKINLRLFDKANPLENSILINQWSIPE